MQDVAMIAACGIDCDPCPLRRAAFDPEAVERLVPWFKEQGWLKEGEGAAELAARGPYCEGCRGSREVHWSADCWILRCCVDDRGLSHCSECAVFPCERLVGWAQGGKGYAAALERLRAMRKG